MSGLVIWFTGLPAAGKSTLARAVQERLTAQGLPVCLLDGDDVRDALVPKPGYTDDQRAGFYATLARLAGLLARQRLVVLVAATAHRRAYREQGRAAAPKFLEVYVKTPLEECERRDDKGLLARAHRGELPDVPGIDAPYEPPLHPDFVAEAGRSPESAAAIARQAAQLFQAPETVKSHPTRVPAP